MAINIDLGLVKTLDELEHDRATYEYAIAYINMGFKLLPQRRDSKGFMKNLGIEHATDNPEIIKHWFGPNGPYEGYNILGKPPDGICIIDVDQHAGKDNGFANAGLEKRDLMEGLCVLTSGDGIHFYTSDNKVTFFKKIPGIEKKNCALLPPSIINGVQMKWGTGGEPGSIPEKMLTALGGKTPKKKEVIEEFATVAPDEYLRELLTYFDPGCPYDEWRAVGMALHDNDPGQGHLDLWVEWSSQSGKFVPGECERKWETFNTDRSRKVTLAWMLYEARLRGREATVGDMKYSGINMDAYAEVIKMNGRFMATNQGGNTIIHITKHELVRTSTNDFKNLVAANLPPILVGDKYVPAAEYWLKSKYRREGRIVMEYPGQEEEGDINQYTGLAIKPIPCRPSEIQFFLDHTLNVICRGNEKHYEFLLDMLAQKLQNPLDILGIALVLKGREGTGKSQFCNIFRLIVGTRHATKVSSRDSLLGAYSGRMASQILVIGEEAVFSAHKGEAERLKALITESPLDWNDKFTKHWSQKNCLALMFTTNEDWAIPAGFDSRRFFALKISDIHMRDKPYWDQYLALMGCDNNSVPNNPEYLGKILHFFLTRKITHDLSNAMETEELLEQRKLTGAESMEAAFVEWTRQTFINSKEDESLIEGAGKEHSFAVVTYRNERWIEAANFYNDFRRFYYKGYSKGRGIDTDKNFRERLSDVGMPALRVKKRSLKLGAGRYPGNPESRIAIVPLIDSDKLEDLLAKHYPLFMDTSYYEEADDD